jgi:hypothetical protein
MITPIELQLSERYTLKANIDVSDIPIDDLTKMSVTDLAKKQPIPDELKDYDDIDPEHGWNIVQIKQISTGILHNELLVEIIFERVAPSKEIWLENAKCPYCRNVFKTFQEYENNMCKWCAGEIADSGC